MSKVKVQAFAISLDGFGAGPRQSLDNPLGAGGTTLHQWFYPTRTFQQMVGGEGGTTGVDDEFARRSMEGMGAWIMGRNMFGPVRGDWPDFEWKGWWGEEPPYHCPVFVLTHHAREPLVMQGGTTFHFVTGGIHEALERAREAADGRDIRIGGGADTIRQYLREGLIDELHLAVAPVFLGAGERIFDDVNMAASGYECVRFESSKAGPKGRSRRSGDRSGGASRPRWTPRRRIRRTGLRGRSRRSGSRGFGGGSENAHILQRVD